MKRDIKLDSEIEILKKKITEYETSDSVNKTPPELKELQSIINYTHQRLDTDMGLLLAVYIFYPEIKFGNLEKNIQLRIIGRSGILLVEIDFYRKIQLLKKIFLLEDKKKINNLCHLLEEVNRMRISFSHPNAKLSEKDKYKDKYVYKKALETIYSAIQAMEAIFDLGGIFDVRVNKK